MALPPQFAKKDASMSGPPVDQSGARPPRFAKKSASKKKAGKGLSKGGRPNPFAGGKR